jgi:hypothetical protein
MTPTNLPDLYARVTAKRPELAVMELTRGCVNWCIDDGNLTYFDVLDETAAALILARWVEALPEMAWLGHCGQPHVGWRVNYRKPAATYPETVWFSPVEDTPLEALAAFWLEAP